MPITLQVHHPDRMVVGLVRGVISAQDLDGFAAEIAATHAERYRKIIDVTGAASGLTAEDLAAFSQRMHSAPLPPQRGPIALVANQESTPLARLFARLMGDDRPVEVFASIHAARQWLYANSKIS
jgi:hypothetical protein